MITHKAKQGNATAMPANVPNREFKARPVGAGDDKRKLTHMKVRKAAGMEHIQCCFPLFMRYAAPVHNTIVASVWLAIPR